MNNIKTRAYALLKQSLNDDAATFHEHQWDAISTLVEDRARLLVVQRTGWGKSAVYFIATRLMREQGYGPTIIISPLLALMRNQIDSAARYDVRLGTINSANTREENDQAGHDLLTGRLDAIIISPEQLAKPSFNSDVLRPIADRVGLFVIDEAHCISDWGHDFRPDYKRIVNILPFLPVNMPVLATTATANKRVMSDVCQQLGDGIKVFRGDLTRESLHLQAVNFDKRSQRLAWLADVVPHIDGTGIIYVATTRDAEQVADWLQSRGVNAHAYYGSFKGMSSEGSTKKRMKLEQLLLDNQIKVLVATSALGMGYDKPDLSFVIHYQSPGSVVSYYQQVGRAGRGIPQAYGILMSGSEDDDIQRYFIEQAFPQERLVKEILETLENADDGLAMKEILSRVNGSSKKTEAALKFLAAESPAPVMITQQNPIKYSRTLIDYRLPHETIERLSKLKETEWETMQAYVQHGECLMQFLSNQLDDPHCTPCGKCVNCDPLSVLTTEYSHDTGIAAAEFLENVFIEIEPRKRLDLIDFPVYGFPRDLGSQGLLHQSGRALCQWGEAGWGEIAKKGKEVGQFDPRLASASARMITQRWKPEPFPAWVTYVPSQNRPRLVAEFAERLATILGLPCLNVIEKIKKNKQQKFMQNTNHRCRNLDGVFQIASDIPDGPVLLIDDAVDSRWTFTVLASLLLQAGSGPVYPFALMSTSSNT